MRIFWLKWGCSCCLIVSCGKTQHKFQLFGITKHTVPTFCGLLRKKDISIHSASFTTILQLETVWNLSKYRAITKTRVFTMFLVFYNSIIYFLTLMYHSFLADFHHSVLKLTLVQQCLKSSPGFLLPNHTINSDTT